MAVQTEILTRTVDQTLKGTSVAFRSGTGALALGAPGKIYDTYPGRGPGAHTITLKKDAEVGTFVEGEGVIINKSEYTYRGGLEPTLMLPAGSVVEVATMAHIIVKESEVEKILAGMEGRLLDYPFEAFEGDEASDASDDSDSEADPLVVVEVRAVKA